jgi:hypothetical protein
MLVRIRTVLARSSTCSQAVRQKSSTSTSSFEREAVAVSEKSAWEKFVPDALAFGIAAGTVTLAVSTGYYTVTTVNRLNKELALAAKDLEAAEEAAKQALALAAKDLEVAKEEAAKDLEAAVKEYTERWLLYGYAEEFQRYQKQQAGIHKGESDVALDDGGKC